MLRKLWNFFRREDFRRHPVRAIWRRLYWRLHWKLFPSHSFVVPFYGGQRIRLALSSASSGIYLNDGFSDRDIAECFLEFLKPGMIVLDCGAHIGEYTLLSAFLVGAEGKVHAFEPDPRVFCVLEQNILLNRLQNVVANRVAVADREGEAVFFLDADPTASSLHRYADSRVAGLETVPVTTLDCYVQEYAISRVDAIKIDVEGAAFSVLKGSSRILSELKPTLIIAECERNDDPRVIMELLQRHGYDTYILGKGRHRWTVIEARYTR